MADENKNDDPFAGFQATKATDGIPVEDKGEPKTPPAAEAKTSMPPVSDEADGEEGTDPLAAFRDEGDQGDADSEGNSDDDDGDGAGDGLEDDADDEDELSGEDGEGEEGRDRKSGSAKKRIAELTKARREAERRAADLERQLAERDQRSQQKDAPAGEGEDDGDQKTDAPQFEVKDPATGKAVAEPDPSKYKYGEVDSQYLRDVVNYQTAYAHSKVQHDAEQTRQAQAAEQHVQRLRESWDKVQEDGLSRYDDFEETVLVAGDRGDFDLTQSTFEMAAESEFGADILYHLASNPKTASKVAKMNERDQARYLGRLEAAIETSRKGGDKGKQKRKAPGAAPPPTGRTPRGKGGRFVNPARSGNFADFEAAVNRQNTKR